MQMSIWPIFTPDQILCDRAIHGVMDMHFRKLRTVGIGAGVNYADMISMDKETCFYYDGEKFCFIRGGEVLTAKAHGQCVRQSGTVAEIFSILSMNILWRPTEHPDDKGPICFSFSSTDHMKRAVKHSSCVTSPKNISVSTSTDRSQDQNSSSPCDPQTLRLRHALMFSNTQLNNFVWGKVPLEYLVRLLYITQCQEIT